LSDEQNVLNCALNLSDARLFLDPVARLRCLFVTIAQVNRN